MNRVLVIGGEGYIGSRLRKDMSVAGFRLGVVDLGWHGSWDYITRQIDYSTISKDSLADYSAVVVVAGHSSVAMCVGQPHAAAHNNVTNLLGLLEKLEPEQKLVYFSSGSVYGAGGGCENAAGARESDVVGLPANEYDASKRSLDCMMQSQRRHTNWYGLRCSTVSGWSPNLRTDLMINAMWDSAKQYGHVEVFGGAINRPIVSIRDVSKTVIGLLQSEASPGIYNLRSCNSTNTHCAMIVADTLGVPIVHTKRPGNIYSFRVDDSKLRRLGIECNDTIRDILEDLQVGGPSFKADRRTPRAYP